MNKFRALFLAVFCTSITMAQEVSVSIELDYSDDGTVEGYPEGFSTWKIYAVLPAADDFLSSVFASSDGAPLTITTSTNQIWNSAYGGVSAMNINSSIWDVMPVAQYDSYVTIGQEDMNAVGAVTYLTLFPSFTVIDETFGSNGELEEYVAPNLYIEDGMWFNLIDDPDGVAGDDLKILIAQVTTDGDIEVCVSFQIFAGGQNQEGTYYDDYCGMQLNPLSVSDVEQQNVVAIAPNPMNDQTVINFNGLDASCVNVRDLSGKIVQSVPANATSAILDRNELSTGIYLIQVINTKGAILESQRLIVR